jgi:hypothetical protein
MQPSKLSPAANASLASLRFAPIQARSFAPAISNFGIVGAPLAAPARVRPTEESANFSPLQGYF